VTCHTDHVGQGSTFVAIKGFTTDGAHHIPKALANGATHVIAHQESDQDSVEKVCAAYGATCTFVSNTRQALAEEANKTLGYPTQKLRVIGVTGTKGKTTTSYLIEHMLKNAGHKTALVSTVVNRIMNEEETSQRTTPESDYLFMFFAECVKRGVEYVVMEVSSHALSLSRVHTLTFDVACFTNLTPEHMDYHPTLEDYFLAKMKLFSQIKSNGTIIINGDDAWALKAYQHALRALPAAQILTICKNESTAPSYASLFTPLQTSFDGITCSLHIQKKQPVQFSCPALAGIYNCYNASMAVAAVQSLGFSQEVILQGLQTFPGVPGRLQKHVLGNGAVAFVDFAHNSSSIKEVLLAL
ncbi:MAG: UDP-N-acetylmuramyl-tripeptide synthetase, partial [Pseudomonadota bacterium]